MSDDLVEDLLTASASDSKLSDADLADGPRVRRVSTRVCEVCRGEGVLSTETGKIWCLVCDGRGGSDPSMVHAARDYHRGYFQLVRFEEERDEKKSED